MQNDDPDKLNSEEVRQKLNLETGQLSWSELTRHFARGVVVVVDPGLDLIEVAAALAEDNTSRFEHWVESGQIHRALDDDARCWEAEQSQFWSAVVAPWVLVQIIPPKSG